MNTEEPNELTSYWGVGAGAFAEQSAGVRALLNGLAEAAIPRTSQHHCLAGGSAFLAAGLLLTPRAVV
jgi:hypothetical protein